MIDLALRPSARLKNASEPILAAILEHPFLRELVDGSLPRAVFREYVKQDWLYLEEFLRTTALIATKSHDAVMMKTLLKRTEFLVSMEHHFHHKHAAELGVDFARPSWEMNSANYAYTRHMLYAAASGTIVEALGALLPCPCVYIHVGDVLYRGPRPRDPMYAEWIEFYGPGPLAERTRELEEIFDELASRASPDELARAERNYLISARYEWMFWDAPYRALTWPV
ncbi:MAG: thiaminase II [Chloroflexota bacterium]|nr:MAG: thiaminase II [Chloroflexota bacterium]